jgi:hypothetical protein
VLLLIFGSSAAGKTCALEEVRRRRTPDLAIHDFDEVGVPSRADRTWRQHANEVWIGRALHYQSQGLDLLLAAQTPFGELLASPSALLLEAISACLIDCDDTTRAARLRARGSKWFERSGGDLQAYLGWADWMRRHAEDPMWRPDVIRDGAAEELHWERWSDWQRGDPRWRVWVIDSATLPVERVPDQLSAWIAEERALVLSGAHPLRQASLR